MALFKKYILGYKPHELGIDNMPEIDRVFLDDCGGDQHHYDGDIKFGFIAHTHSCVLDPIHNSICLSRSCLRNSDGTISDAVWHEYAHVISELPPNLFLGHTDTFPGTHLVNSKFAKSELEVQDFLHGEAFKKALDKIGRPDLNSRGVSMR